MHCPKPRQIDASKVELHRVHDKKSCMIAVMLRIGTRSLEQDFRTILVGVYAELKNLDQNLA
jgi:hypothetical protein